jgi:hypothetical protein
MPGSLLTLKHFCDTYGEHSLDVCRELLNHPYIHLYEVADRIGMNRSRFSRFVADHFDLYYILKPELQHALDLLRDSQAARELETRERQATIISLARGARGHGVSGDVG